jgi:hypothetical protein
MKKHIVLFALALLLAGNSVAAKHLLPVAFNKPTPAFGLDIKLTLGNKTYNAVMYTISYVATDKSAPGESRAMASGNSRRFDGTPTINTLYMTLKTEDVEQELLDWIFAATPTPKTGKIEVINGDKVIKTITFKLLTPTSYNEESYGVFKIAPKDKFFQPNTNFSMHFTEMSIRL